ncbi:hypothetical protein KR51_00034470 [Rubidibacter lacunae KORDI 51-2]|uniref:Pyruvate/2-oxoglutarate dehydrogenase complex,dihydrolipoamide dehydrogenase (E3) component n=1 Tax=Rubidibacter lacunae KORDI 51-2 TaxID=582515 RepID=U5DEY5_9CHRO|nr:DUF4330 domain-containing protein [Rubidibacter lacunae]ERN40156.1 hypothetical protein KR51_00034470 [Rubidibacter lacunae KORDI 51-2]
MTFIDSKGRLFGKLSIIDVCAIVAIALVVFGIFFFPSTTGSVAQLSGTQPIEVDVMIQGLSVRDPDALLKELQAADSTDIIIRKQPYGRVDLISVELVPSTVYVPLPDGSVVAKPDPRPKEQFSTTWLVTIGGEAQVTQSGFVLGNNKVKIGTPVELEGRDYNFRGSIIAVRSLVA